LNHDGLVAEQQSRPGRQREEVDASGRDVLAQLAGMHFEDPRETPPAQLVEQFFQQFFNGLLGGLLGEGSRDFSRHLDRDEETTRVQVVFA